MRSLRSPKQKGFTLIELSIVLIIIGLIVSGVLVGQDLIDGAKLRATVGQIETFNTAVNTFKLKYDALPGDIDGATYGLTAHVSTGAGNGAILDDGAVIASVYEEPTLFWEHLSEAGLIQGACGVAANGSGATVGTNLPATKMGVNGIGIYSVSGTNYYQIGAANSAATDAATYADATLTALQAFNIDNKLDNGLPNSGIIIAAGGTAANTAVDVTGDDTRCAEGLLAADTWDFGSGDGKYCQLRIKAN